MKRKDSEKLFAELPPVAGEYIRLVIKRMGYRRKVREDVQAELAAHFEDALRNCNSEQEKEQKAQKVIDAFGDAKMLAVLLRRAKKRCRPLWRMVFVRSFQTIGVAFICLVFYCIYLSLGKPTISINYVQRAGEIACPVADEGLNAAPLYLEAIRLYAEEPNIAEKKLLSVIRGKQTPAELTEEELTLMKRWIADNNGAFEIFKQATNKPYCWWKRQAKNNVMFDMLMPNLSDMRKFGYLLCWRAKLDAATGQIDEAFNDLSTCYRAGMHLKGPRTLIEQLVGISMEALACSTSSVILQDKEIDSPKLQAFQNEFEKLIASDTFTVNFEVEKFCFYDTIQRCFTDNGCGSGHFIPGSLNFTNLDSIFDDPNQWNIITYTISLGYALTTANRCETIKKFENAYGKYEQWTKTTPWQKHQVNFNAGRELGLADRSFVKVARHPLYYILMPAMEKVIELSYRNKVHCEAVVTTLAIMRYKQDKGDYPETLEQVVEAGYLKELPMDPWSDKPLVYRKTEGNFILYSVGSNFKDDGGQVFRDDKGKVKQWADEGDWVFWPVVK
ncbi:MAG: hypothetical protein NTW55_02795 [Planctomycetota bacterium]|nr:hypothetical protein [Planctomycetota bacterium]